MNKKFAIHRVSTLLALMFILGACLPNADSADIETTRNPNPTDSSPASPGSATDTPLPTITDTPLATEETSEMAATATSAVILTRLAMPTATPIPTLAPSPTITPTPTAVPPDAVWMEATWIYDGGYQAHDRYRSAYMPIFVLQANGRFLRQSSANWYEETTLTTEQMCALQAELIETGVFAYEGPPFKWDELTEEQQDILNGSGPFHMNWLIHGDPAAALYIPADREFLDKLVDELANAWTIFNTYWPQDTTPYIAEEAVVYIQMGLDDEIDYQPINPWPTTLPALADLFDVGTPFELLDGYPDVEVILRDEELALFQEEFGPGTLEGGFRDGGLDYYVMLRPLLPLDQSDMRWASFYEVGFRPDAFPLPFTCDS